MLGIKKSDWLAIPNIISYIRILLIPIFIYFYMEAQTTKDYYIAAAIVALSGFTDFLDGRIARKYNMITELGKLIDPVADKLTQCALLFCLATRYKLMWLLLIFMLVKESIMFFGGLYLAKYHKKLDGANWYGKVATFIFYIIMVLLLLFPTINILYANISIVICTLFMANSFVMYSFVYYRMYLEIKNGE